MIIQEIYTTKIFVFPNEASIPTNQKVDNRIFFLSDTQKLTVYKDSTFSDVASDIIYATNFQSLPTAGSFTGKLGLDGEKGELYYWSSSSEWTALGGSGSVTLADNKTAIDALTDVEAGDVAIAKDTSILYYYDGSAWQSTQELITLADKTSVTVGGINVNTTIEGKTNQQLWEMLLLKELNPSLTAPSITFSWNAGATLQEIGKSYSSITLTSTFSRGSISPAYGTSGYRSGLPNKYTYTGSQIAGDVASTSLSNTQTISDYTVVSGNQSWTMKVSYDAGEQPKTNKGNNYSSALDAGTTSAKTLTITGVYPVYVNGTKQALKANNSSFTVNMPAESADNRWTIEVPATWNTVKGFEVANLGTTSFVYLGGGASESVALFNVEEITKDVNSNATGVAYKKYTLTGSLQSPLQLRFTF